MATLLGCKRSVHEIIRIRFATVRIRVEHIGICSKTLIVDNVPLLLDEPKSSAKRIKTECLMGKRLNGERKEKVECNHFAHQSCPCVTVGHVTIDLLSNDSTMNEFTHTREQMLDFKIYFDEHYEINAYLMITDIFE